VGAGNRRVTQLTRKRAFQTIKIIAKAMLDGELAVTYSDLASRLEMPNETGRGLAAILDEAAAMCVKHDLPDVSSLVVTKESMLQGRPFPSKESFKNGIWPISGLSVDDIPAEQERVRRSDWMSVRSLGLS
jgi:hypothetical protein